MPETFIDSIGRARVRRTLTERFWPKIGRRGADQCWEWAAGCNPKGYGRINVGGKARLAHRVAYELIHGPVPAGLLVCHHCDNPPCCNPAHLFLGTPADNMRDKSAKGRAFRAANERSGKAVLSDAEVVEIRSLVAEGVAQVDVAARFGIHPAHVSRIANGRRRPTDANHDHPADAVERGLLQRNKENTQP